MKKIVINKSHITNNLLTIREDAIIYLNDLGSISDLEINILGCNVKIIDKSNLSKRIKVENSNVDYFIITSDNFNNKFEMSVDNSEISVEVIDLLAKSTNLIINSDLVSRNSKMFLNTAVISKGNNEKIYDLTINSLVGDTYSKIDNFGIAKDESKISFSDVSYIKKAAKNSEVYQDNKILLLDEKAEGINKPILIIDENDVKAGHGSSVGMIDKEVLFYLTSRGISLSDARNLICLGKVSFMINKLEDETIKEKLIASFTEGVY